jgi:hypothetical protein
LKAVRLSIGLLILVAAGVFEADAQQAEVDRQFWSEANLYWQFHPAARLVFMSSESRDRDVAYADIEYGAYLDFYVTRFRPLLFRRIAQRDDARMQRLVLRAGYIDSHSLNQEPPTVEHRPLIQGTIRWTFPYALLLSSRSRVEFRIINGEYAWRYRHELKIERDFKIRRLPLTVYASAEAFYDSKSGTVNRYRYSSGTVLLIERWFGLEPYFTRQSTSFVQPRNENALGLTLNFYLGQK